MRSKQCVCRLANSFKASRLNSLKLASQTHNVTISRFFSSDQLKKSESDAVETVDTDTTDATESTPRMRTPDGKTTQKRRKRQSWEEEKMVKYQRKMQRLANATHFKDDETEEIKTEAESAAEEKEKKKQYEIVYKKAQERFHRHEQVLKELKDLKAFVEDNANEPGKIAHLLVKEVFSFQPGKNTCGHRSEVMRRIVWLSHKYLSDEQWFKLVTNDTMLSSMEDISTMLDKSVAFMTIQEMCDTLWSLATLGYRPMRLVTGIVSKMDRYFQHSKKIVAAASSASQRELLSDEERVAIQFQHYQSESEETIPNNRSDIPIMDLEEFSEAVREHEYKIEKAREREEAFLDSGGVGTTGGGAIPKKEESYEYIRGDLRLPVSANELSDIIYAYGQLRIESGGIVRLLDTIIDEHFLHNNRLLDRFLPKDLTNVAIGYAMMDPGFHFYPVCWGINRHFNLLGAYVPWTFHEKLKILHYDVCNRYINQEWNLQIKGDLQKLIDHNFIDGLPRLLPPFYDPLLAEVHDTLSELVLADQYYCKNIEGYQIPFSRWEARDEPCVLEPLSVAHFAQLDDVNNGKLLLGRSRLRKDCLEAIFQFYQPIPYFEWPDTDHLRQLLVQTKVKLMDAPTTIRLRLMQHGLEPHYQSVQKDTYF